MSRLPPQVLLHVAVFLFGFTAILGELIRIPTFWMVWWRLLLASGGFGLMLAWGQRRAGRAGWRIPRRRTALVLGVGFILGVHWLTFFGSIRLTNVSTALVCLASTGLMTALLEPLLLGGRVKSYQLLLGVLALVGIGLIMSINLNNLLGIGVALLSALTSALYTILNRSLVQEHSSNLLNFWEMLTCWGLFCLIAPFWGAFVPDAPWQWPSGIDALWLAVLAFLTTNFAYTLSMNALRRTSAFTVVLAVNLEPLYGMLLAYLIFNERVAQNPLFALGTLLVLGSVVLAPILEARWARQHSPENPNLQA